MSTISNERLEEIAEEDNGSDVLFESSVLARELLALRKERERAEPVAWQYDWAQCVTCDGPQDFKPVIETEAPAEWAITDGRVKNLRKLYTAPPAPDIADDSLPFDPQIAEYEQMMEAEQAQADTTAQQFESLASVKQPSSNLAATGNASRDSDDNSSPDSQTTIKQSDGWIPCSERMPDSDGNYWCWWDEDKRQGPGWFIKSDLMSSFQSSEITHWMPLPEPPCK